MEIYNILNPTVTPVPIIISSPHSGTYIPEDIKSQMKPEMVEYQDVTDWFIDRLYDFAPALGITMITANYHRWVIDLNRSPDSRPLYSDNRVITGLAPTTDFNGKPIYRENVPTKEETEIRLDQYYWPYHRKIQALLEETKQKFGCALLFDAHSIKKQVPGIQQEAFPDLILGDNDGLSAEKALIDTALIALKRGDYGVKHNNPFKGGYITRHFGHPDLNVSAIQLEMVKTNYMNEDEMEYDPNRASRIRSLLQNMFSALIQKLV